MKKQHCRDKNLSDLIKNWYENLSPFGISMTEAVIQSIKLLIELLISAGIIKVVISVNW